MGLVPNVKLSQSEESGDGTTEGRDGPGIVREL